MKLRSLSSSSSSCSMSLSIMVMTIMLLMFENVSGAYDETFCNNNMQAKGAEIFEIPDNPEDLHVLVEFKDQGPQMPVPYNNLEFFFAKDEEMAHITYNSEDVNVATIEMWALTGRDELISIPSDSSQCEMDALDTVPVVSKFLAVEKKNDKYVLGQPSELLQYSRGLQKFKFVKRDTYEDRGLAVKVISTCHYDKINDVTYVGEFLFNDNATTTMPIGQKDYPTMVVRASLKTNKDKLYSLDFTRYNDLGDPYYDPAFYMRPGVVCRLPVTTTTADVNIPTMPANVDFLVQKYATNDFGKTGDAELVETSKMAFFQSSGIYLKEWKRASAGRIIVEQILAYYGTGIQFTMDKTTGGCLKGKIDDKNKYIFKHQGPDKNMGTAAQFFHTEGDYAYMGTMPCRIIECDAFTAADTDNVYTWYFMSNFAKGFLMIPKEEVRPVQLEIYSVADPKKYTRYDFYQWNTNDGLFRLPNVEQCYNPEQIINFQFRVKGTYDKLVARDMNTFTNAVKMSVMEIAGTGVATRIPQVNFFPWSRNEVMVQVTILDKLTDVDGVTYPAGEKTVQELYDTMKTRIDTGNAQIFIQRPTGQAMADIVQGSMETFTPQHGQSGPTDHDRNKDKDKDKNKDGDKNNNGSGSQYGGGDMAGLAFGMILLSVLATCGVFFLIYKFKLSAGGDGGYSVGMSKLSDP